MIFLQVLLLIGENFDHSDEICGAVVNVRAKLDKIGEYQCLYYDFIARPFATLYLAKNVQDL